jgi:hypothetical protein
MLSSDVRSQYHTWSNVHASCFDRWEKTSAAKKIVGISCRQDEIAIASKYMYKCMFMVLLYSELVLQIKFQNLVSVDRSSRHACKILKAMVWQKQCSYLSIKKIEITVIKKKSFEVYLQIIVWKILLKKPPKKPFSIILIEELLCLQWIQLDMVDKTSIICFWLRKFSDWLWYFHFPLSTLDTIKSKLQCIPCVLLIYCSLYHFAIFIYYANKF